jgi:hypothetical protein
MLVGRSKDKLNETRERLGANARLALQSKSKVNGLKKSCGFINESCPSL